MFGPHQIIRLPKATRPLLLVVVDTEEEFDWDAGFDRNATAVTALSELWRAQDLFDDYGIRPTYVIDYPVASRAAETAVLKEYGTQGRAEIGLQMHPWVNPPFQEPPSASNSWGTPAAPSRSASCAWRSPDHPSISKATWGSSGSSSRESACSTSSSIILS